MDSTKIFLLILQSLCIKIFLSDINVYDVSNRNVNHFILK